MSAPIRSVAQSPPPSTLPARTVASRTPCSAMRPPRKTTAVCGDDNLRRRFAGAIWIATAQWVRLAAGRASGILVALVTRDDKHDAGSPVRAHRLEQIRRTLGVDLECLARAGIALPHQRLRRQVKNEIRLVRDQPRPSAGPRPECPPHGGQPERRLPVQPRSCSAESAPATRSLSPAPSRASHSASQEPLKPVCPVRNTRLSR